MHHSKPTEDVTCSQVTSFAEEPPQQFDAAKNAGIACILVTWGFRAEENLKELGADYIAHSTQEIIDIVS